MNSLDRSMLADLKGKLRNLESKLELRADLAQLSAFLARASHFIDCYEEVNLVRKLGRVEKIVR